MDLQESAAAGEDTAGEVPRDEAATDMRARPEIGGSKDSRQNGQDRNGRLVVGDAGVEQSP